MPLRHELIFGEEMLLEEREGASLLVVWNGESPEYVSPYG